MSETTYIPFATDLQKYILGINTNNDDIIYECDAICINKLDRELFSEASLHIMSIIYTQIHQQ